MNRTKKILLVFIVLMVLTSIAATPPTHWCTVGAKTPWWYTQQTQYTIPNGTFAYTTSGTIPAYPVQGGWFYTLPFSNIKTGNTVYVRSSDLYCIG